ncbi:MAG TPA: AMP-binding protein [Candidatus Acidoferrum sp.]|nr:AMP-binding protein [Candidatus Acidoferrum sp.]
MLDLSKYESLGAALRDALKQWPEEVCLIEADRDREKARLTYRQFDESARPLAAALQARGFKAGDRAAIIMTNQSKWLISAYAVFYAGGVLVPLDYKLTPKEQLALLVHSRASVLITEYPIWRALIQTEEFDKRRIDFAVVTEAPAAADLGGAIRWEEFRADREPDFVPRRRSDWACIVYSSGTGGRPKGCVMTHENYLEQCAMFPALYPVAPGDVYLSILPTNHAIDFMLGFFYQFVSGGTVVHLRTLRPEYVREAFAKYKVTHVTLVPLILKNLQKGFEARFDALPPRKRRALDFLIGVNKRFTRGRARLGLSRRLLPQVHEAFGGKLRAIIVGGAFTEPRTLQFFYDLGVPVANAYGLTEACMGISVNDLKPFRADTVGKLLPRVEVRIVNPGGDEIGEVAVRSRTVMSHYLDDPELTAETIVDGWLMTGDLGRLDKAGHLQLFGRKKNMIVTIEGKNIYPEDIESAFEGLPVKEFCVFAANYIWPKHSMVGEQLVMALHPETGRALDEALHAEMAARNQRLLNYKRISGYIVWEKDFPRTASMKIKRVELAEQIRECLDRQSVKAL